MPNRGQTQDQGKSGRNPGTFSNEDDESVEGQDLERTESERQARGSQRDLPEDEGTDIESDDDVGSDDDDDEVTGVSQ